MLALGFIAFFGSLMALENCGKDLSKLPAQTVDWYDENASRFISTNDHSDHSADYFHALSFVQAPSPRILDVGCAQGRDIEGFLKLEVGEVLGIEPSRPLAEFAASRTGALILQKTFEEIEVGKDLQPESFDLIWAMASFLHIPADRQVSALEKASELLRVGGIFFASYKVGEGERIETRGEHRLLYFDVSEVEFRRLIERVPQLRIESLDIQNDPSRPGLQWLRAVLRRVK
jgi:SAM-dependent methyltransferase